MPASRIFRTWYGRIRPHSGNTCDNVKRRAPLNDCLAPDGRVEIEVKGIKDV
ncbi:hypothetical protein ACLK1T_01550 [Escherichia coli]